MKYNFEVENIRCGGCANTISTKLTELDDVAAVDVVVEEKKVIVTTSSEGDDNVRQILSEKLAKMGYPEVGSAGSNGLRTKAASVVSCAIGKVSNKK